MTKEKILIENKRKCAPLWQDESSKLTIIKQPRNQAPLTSRALNNLAQSEAIKGPASGLLEHFPRELS
jgi:hypothetical protein